MGNATCRASTRPLPATSTLPELCGHVPYGVRFEDVAQNACTLMKRSGFVVVKNIFSSKEMEGIQPAADAMVHSCVEKAGGAPAWGNRAPNRQSASGFYLNMESQAAGGIIWKNKQMHALLETILGENP